MTLIILTLFIHFALCQMFPSITILYQYFNLVTQLKGFKYCYLTLMILFNITLSFTQLNGSNYWYLSLTIPLNISHLFTHLNYQTVLFQTIQCSISHLFALSLNLKKFYLTHRTLSGATTPGQRGSGSDGNKGVLHIPESSSIAGASQSDCLISYTVSSLGEFYLSAEMQSMYSTTPTDSAKLWLFIKSCIFLIISVEQFTYTVWLIWRCL